MREILKKIITIILKIEVRLILWRFKPKIAAIGGSVGKTSTKEAVALILSLEFKIRKSEKSYNSEIGVPLTIIGAKTGWNNAFLWFPIILKGLKIFLFGKNYPEFLVLEMGVGKPKDMENLVSWIKPDIAVITTIGTTPVHVEKFKNIQELIIEKKKLTESVKTDGWLILNADDKITNSFGKKNVSNMFSLITYGFSESADLKASNYKIDEDGISFKVDYKGNIVPIKINKFYGRHNVYPVLAALAVGLSQGMNIIKIAEKLPLLKNQPGRLNLIKGISNSLIFDDTYNSSPIAVEAALETLAEFPSKRKIAVLGDMKELGNFSRQEHDRIGSTLRDKGIWFLLTTGEEANFFAEGADKSGFDAAKIFKFKNTEETTEKLKEIITEGDLILVKGSQSVRMEKIVGKIMAHPEEKEKLLVRQEKEWKER